MGCIMRFECATCDIDLMLGEGAYSSWLTHVRDVATFDQTPRALRELRKNQMYRQCLVEHAGHDWRVYDPDNEAWDTGRC